MGDETWGMGQNILNETWVEINTPLSDKKGYLEPRVS